VKKVVVLAVRYFFAENLRFWFFKQNQKEHIF